MCGFWSLIFCMCVYFKCGMGICSSCIFCIFVFLFLEKYDFVIESVFLGVFCGYIGFRNLGWG